MHLMTIGRLYKLQKNRLGEGWHLNFPIHGDLMQKFLNFKNKWIKFNKLA
jgi:hypothetical protein